MARWRTILFSFLCVLPCAAQKDISPQDREFFESRIRPILAQECYECHRTGGKQKGGLALDHRAAVLAGGERGQVLVPGNPAKSLLIQAIQHEHAELKMPKAGAKLDPEVIADFTAWIEKGAPDPRDAPPSDEAVAADSQWDAVLKRRKRWWSFLPLEMPSLPGDDESAHPIDRFVEKRLQADGLSKAPQADRPTLIRRLSFVLRGLPPTPKEIDAFTADQSEKAYDRLVAQFLDSPQFGERWARHWMDWVRYADSHGSEGDPMIPYAWRYRDYLIRALNDDVPYDQLVKEHLAGDLLENPRINSSLGLNESAIGPAHLRMVFHGFAPTDALGEQVRFTDDQINVVSKAFMGLTVSCARCHNHKFDAISQRDFYAWYGIFASCPPASISATASTEAEADARKTLPKLKTEIRTALANAWMASVPALPDRLKALDEAIGKAESTSNLLHPLWLARAGKPLLEGLQSWRERPQEHEAEPDWNITQEPEFQSWTIQGKSLAKKSKSGNFSISPDDGQLVTGIYPAGRYSHLLSSKDRGVLLSPRVMLDDDRDVWMLVAGDGGAVLRYAVQNYPRNGTVYPTRNLSGGQWRWERFPLDYWTGDYVHVEFTTAADQPVLTKTNADRSWIGVRRVALFPKGSGPFRDEFAFGRPLLHALGPKLENLVVAYKSALANSISAWAENRASDDQALFLDQALRAGLLSNSPEALPDVAALAKRYREIEEEKIPVPVRVPGVLERVPFDQELMVRGDHKQPAEPVARTFLEAIDSTPYSAQGSGRLHLARDLFRPDNPLSRRVSVNRFWHHAFGEGLVRTPDNLGRLGQKPSHPELLDYLSVWFEENGFSIKGLLRHLVTSDTWKASTEASDEARAQDPENLLLSHAHLRRLDAEAIRDSLLAVSGQLEDGGDGPPVTGDRPRRSVYVRVKRNSLDAFLGTFDAPVPASTTGRRDVTNVPGQSLTLLNDPFILKTAREWTTRLEGTDAAKVNAMFLQGLGRQPTNNERSEALIYVETSNREKAQTDDLLSKLKKKLEQVGAEIQSLEEKAKQRVLATREPSESSEGPLPMAAWNFESDLRDQVGSHHGRFHGSARLANGALVLDGKGHLSTTALSEDLRAKTLVARVMLSTLDQRGGGVVSVEAGATFDSIVYSEQAPRHWLAGSNGFARTQPFEGEPESRAKDAFVHVAIVYQEDGQILGYLEGKPYGKSYKSSGPAHFRSGKSQFLLGLRHGEPASDRRLRGKIDDAAVFDRALSAHEVAALASGSGNYVSMKDYLAAMTEPERERHREAQASQSELRAELEATESMPSPPSGWADLAHAIFNLKEFIYLR
ncbi:MAG: DUF1549 domain-containing protein [Verrucomicrobiaceae bacterium]|nr:DUF1549 domain-containing protein [Verrucomicrobiaceae bacterium]